MADSLRTKNQMELSNFSDCKNQKWDNFGKAYFENKNKNELEIKSENQLGDSECILVEDVVVDLTSSLDVDYIKETTNECISIDDSTNDSCMDEEEQEILKEFIFVNENEQSGVTENQSYDVVSPKKVIFQLNKLFPCPLSCTFIALNRRSIIKHLIEHKKQTSVKSPTNNNRLECPLCTFKTFHKSRYDEHIYYHKKYTCSFCNYVTDDFAKLHEHKKTHAEYFHCRYCPFKSKKMVVLLNHKRERHSVNSTPQEPVLMFSCKFIPCLFICSNVEDLISHEEWHNISEKQEESAPNFSCKFKPCPFTGSNEEELNTHEWIQHKITFNSLEQYNCQQCHFQTFKKEKFEEHISMHAEEKSECKDLNDHFTSEVVEID